MAVILNIDYFTPLRWQYVDVMFLPVIALVSTVNYFIFRVDIFSNCGDICIFIRLQPYINPIWFLN